ncbi:MAG: type II toxin-antitoxin system HicB family antitoxin [Deltaproteobacteria bacterium]|nr:type II toxin-antitoxin system HicB family antitoxin [Deltaproteobacteria bacterium]
MRAYTAVIQRCPDTGVYIGHVPGIPGAHSQGNSLDEINAEVLALIFEDDEPTIQAEFVGIQTVLALEHNCLASDATATVR